MDTLPFALTLDLGYEVAPSASGAISIRGLPQRVGAIGSLGRRTRLDRRQRSEARHVERADSEI